LTGYEQTTADLAGEGDICHLALDIAQPRPNVTVVTAKGEIDLAAVSQLADCLRQLLRPEHKVILDVIAVVHCSSSGVAALIQATEHARGIGGEFCLVIPTLRHPVRLVLETLGLLDYLPVRPSLALALVPS
jgi:anti-anti-sigma factor